MTVGLGDTLKVTAVMSMGAAITLENVYHLVVTANPNGVDEDVMTDLENYMTLCYSQLNNVLHETVDFVEVRGFNITKDEPLPTAVWQKANTSSPGDILPHGVCALIVFRTNRAKVLGRKFIGGLEEGGNVNGNLAPAVMTAMGAFASTLLTGFVGATSGGEFSYIIRTTFGLNVFPTEAVVRSPFAYQRRRKPAVGI